VTVDPVSDSRAADRDLLNAFTVDVEDYFHVSALASAIPRETWPRCECRVERNTEHLLDLLAEANVHGTFFVLGWVAERCHALIGRIAAAGHEIACHGFSHELIYRQTPAEFRTETERAKHCLEDVIGRSVVGYRAASFSITPVSLWALDILIDLGFEYDSSIFPIHHDRYGIPGAPMAPGPVSAPSGRSLVEFPMCAARFLGVPVPVSGGGYFRLLPYWVTRAGLAQVNRRCKHPFPFYVHPWEIDPDQPRVKAPALSRIRHYTNLGRCEQRLRELLKTFSFAPAREVLSLYGLLADARH
jgi:polysaccharide deacetylase family protein (PEP-CTERM system associated)